MRALRPTNKAISLFLCWGIIVNLPFLVLNIYFSHSRHNVLLVYFMLFLVSTISFSSSRLNAVFLFVIYFFYLVVFFFDGMLFASTFFGLMIFELLYALPNILMLDVFSFGPYLFIALLFIFSALSVPFIAWKIRPVSNRDRIYVCAGFLLLFLLELGLNGSPYYFTEKSQGFLNAILQQEGESVKVDSAIGKAGMEEDSYLKKDRKIFIVMIESLGKFKDERINAEIFASLNDRDISRRFDIAMGTISFRGSTTAGEMRELCGTRNSYLTILDASFDVAKCLPNRLAEMGHRSIAFHGFRSGFFSRHLWYPAMGFTDNVFFEQFKAAGPEDPNRFCGGMFIGYCDRLIGEKIGKMIERGSGHKLYYWLTLNSHFPTRTSPGLEKGIDCEKYKLREQICTMAYYWAEVIKMVAGIAKSKAASPFDILIVGDHSPPSFYRDTRAQFVDSQVPYVSLKWNADAR